jgi:hypothetical protein
MPLDDANTAPLQCRQCRHRVRSEHRIVGKGAEGHVRSCRAHLGEGGDRMRDQVAVEVVAAERGAVGRAALNAVEQDGLDFLRPRAREVRVHIARCALVASPRVMHCSKNRASCQPSIGREGTPFRLRCLQLGRRHICALRKKQRFADDAKRLVIFRRRRTERRRHQTPPRTGFNRDHRRGDLVLQETAGEIDRTEVRFEKRQRLRGVALEEFVQNPSGVETHLLFRHGEGEHSEAFIVVDL